MIASISRALALSTTPAKSLTGFVSSGGGFYRLLNLHSGKVLDVLGRSTANGADVVQWADLNGTNQQWHLIDGGGFMNLLNRNSGQALEVF